MFRGRYEHAIDGKGRTSLPSRFRDVLTARGDSRLIITTGLERCLVVHTLKQWQELEERLASVPKFDESVAMLRRIYVSGAVDCEMDKLGRLLIPAALRSHAGLQRDAIWAGMGDYIELWDKTRYDALRDSILSDPEKRHAMMKRLAELGL